ncbi:MAG: YqhA family protein [Thermodesulfobacterium sp.]|nr:YqhA family protein [Thermodesulfobacterium sp.]
MLQIIKKLIELSRIVVIVPILSLFLGAFFLALYGVYLIAEIFYKFFVDPVYKESTILSTKFITIMDLYLVSIVLYIFAIGLYELFIGKLNVPDWLKIENIDQLKAKLASLIILILAVTFTRKLVEWEKPLETLLFGISIAAIIIVLIFYYKVKEPR